MHVKNPCEDGHSPEQRELGEDASQHPPGDVGGEVPRPLADGERGRHPGRAGPRRGAGSRGRHGQRQVRADCHT
eukprot:3006333-Heterocapsa_arctica.AAC.1